MQIKPTIPYKTLTLILMAVLGLVTLDILLRGAGEEYNQIIARIGLIVLIWCGISMKAKTGSFICLAFMFELGYYLLTLGQTFFYVFTTSVNHPQNLYQQQSVPVTNQAYLYTILCMIALHFGLLLCFDSKKKKVINKNIKIGVDEVLPIDYTETMKFVGWILFAVSIVFYIHQAKTLFNAYKVVGYSAAFDSIGGTTSWNKIFQYLGSYFPFTLFLLLAAYRNQNGKRTFISIMIILISIFNFSIGNRSEPICYIMALMWFYMHNENSGRKKRIYAFSAVVAAFALVFSSSIIGSVRNSSTISMQTLLSPFSEKNGLLTTFTDSVMGLGWCAFPAIKVMEIIPNKIGFHYGQSYFFALLSVFPNFFGGTHISTQYAGLASWLKSTLKMSFGPGFSLPAEAFYNFGWYGIAFVPIIGWFVGKMLKESKSGESTLRQYVMMGGFVVLFSISRRDMLTAVRNIAYYVGLICLIIHVLNNKMQQHRSTETVRTVDSKADFSKDRT